MGGWSKKVTLAKFCITKGEEGGTAKSYQAWQILGRGWSVSYFLFVYLYNQLEQQFTGYIYLDDFLVGIISTEAILFVSFWQDIYNLLQNSWGGMAAKVTMWRAPRMSCCLRPLWQRTGLEVGRESGQKPPSTKKKPPPFFGHMAPTPRT